MKIVIRYIFLVVLNVSWFQVNAKSPDINIGSSFLQIQNDTTKLSYPLNTDGSPFVEDQSSPLFLKNPSNYSVEIVYDEVKGEYIFRNKIGSINQNSPTYMGFDEYRKYDFNKSVKDYWRQRARSESFENQSSLIPKLYVGGEVFETIFGSNTIDIKPQGYAELTFGLKFNKTENPRLTEKLQRTTTFDFKEKIQMNVVGRIGENLEMSVNYNTEATFDFENKMNLKYEGKEDDILQKVEAGDVALPLPGSLITGSQSLFGILTEMKFGKLNVTTVLSQQKGETSTIEVEGGAQKSNFDIKVDDYDANRHFFLSHFFKDHYDEWLEDLSYIKSSINITKVEVWITNKSSNSQQNRNIVGFIDLGEDGKIHTNDDGETYTNLYNNSDFGGLFDYRSELGFYPDDSVNTLYDNVTSLSGFRSIENLTQLLSSGIYAGGNFVGGLDYEKIENARKLNPNEYTLNPRLGYISLNSALNSDEVLAVSFQYESTSNNKIYQVGEFSNEVNAPDVLVIKLLKGTNLSPSFPNWDLMMKNVYAIGAYQVNRENFRLNILYLDDSVGTTTYSLKEGAVKGQNLLRVLNVDQLNTQSLPVPKGDGVFDFLNGITINASNGKIIFPMREPFGKYLEQKIAGDVSSSSYNSNLELAQKYIFKELYDSTQNKAQQVAEKNKFSLTGEYKSSSSSDISLNAFNIPQGSVKVSAGGRLLVENQDYTVDYMLGRVKIINQGLLQSNTPISISLESNALFSFQTKTMMGTHLNYKFNDNLNLGGTILNLKEKPLTEKVNIGDEPISNTIWGLDWNYHTEVPILTKLVDMIPLIDTKAKSSIDFSGEFAHFLPGHNSAIKKTGEAYVDDFEGAKSTIDIRSMASWVLSSIPQGQTELFPEASLINDLQGGFNRAKLSWFNIEPLMVRTGSPVSNSKLGSLFVHEFDEKDLFPDKQHPNNIPTILSVFNVTYYPDEKGPYNYDLLGSTYSGGINEFGRLNNPENRWGGIMRKITTNDFEAANVEFIEFWLMDPFVEDDNNNLGGDLYFNLGDISEDVLRDSRKSFENGLPITEVFDNDTDAKIDTTVWGRVPNVQYNEFSFDNNPATRPFQDVGMDGLRDEDERTFFNDYNESLSSFSLVDSARTTLLGDISSDNYTHYRDNIFDENDGVLERYKNYNNHDGNSPTSEDFQGNFSTVATILPDIEDINQDNTLSENENYYQYKVSIRKQDLSLGKNYITDVKKVNVTLKNGDKSSVNWYQFKIPVYDPDRIIGTISDYKSIRFLRMFLNGFSNRVVLRFAKMDLVRGEWRKYTQPIKVAGENVIEDNDLSASAFDISVVNIEENGINRLPMPYKLPPGVKRQRDPSSQQVLEQNEQSLVLKVDSLNDGYAKATYKNTMLDVRQYKRLKMYVHAEPFEDEILRDGELTVFIRMGSDYQDNYYEYEIPLKVTQIGGEYYSQEVLWPEGNNFDIKFELLQLVKQERNNAMRIEGSDVFTNTVYEIYDGENTIRIKGNPNLSNIRTLMLGVRNPQATLNGNDDGLPKSAELWLNELRLSDFDEKSGWAGTARMSTRFADFANVTVSANRSTRGYGSIEKKLNERQQEDVFQYDMASTVELGKFFPQKANVKIPMYIGFSETKINPYYNPLDPDIPLSAVLNDPNKTQYVKDSIKRISQDYTKRKSINFTNVKINKIKGKPKVYSISNWSVSYAYSETYQRNIEIQYNLLKSYNGSINYNFSKSPKNITPFKKIKLFKKPAFKLINDFNFYFAPSQISFRTNMDRNYNQNLLRNISNPDQIIDPTVNKSFNWGRSYSLRYNLTKSVKFDFNANNLARIDEPEGIVDQDFSGNDYWGNQYNYNRIKDTIVNEIYGFGTTTNYNHKFNLSYSVPINKIRLFNWVSLNYRYSGSYNWLRGPETSDNRLLGNTIKNSNTHNVNSNLNLASLYKKVKFINEIKQKYDSKGRAQEKEKKFKDVVFTKEGVNLKENTAKRISHNLGLEEVEVSVIDKNNNPIKVKMEIINENKLSIIAPSDIDKAIITVIGKKEVMFNPIIFIAENTVRLLTGISSINLTYNENNGTIMPGYMNSTSVLGLTDNRGTLAPGLPFVMGFQDEKYPFEAINNGWLSIDSTINATYNTTHSETWSFKTSYTPITGLRVEISANRTKSNNGSAYYRANNNGLFDIDRFGNYIPQSPMFSGNFTMSYNIIGTSLEKIDDDISSVTFQKFKENRAIISQRLAAERQKMDPTYNATPDQATGFSDGYGETSQEVLIIAFLSAYSGNSPATIPLTIFPSVTQMKPNWRITYDGLAKVEFIKKYVRTLTIAHGYSSSYSISNFNSNINFEDNDHDGFSGIRDRLNNNFVNELDVSAFNLTEQFVPLIGFDMTWNNSLITKIEFKNTRNLNMSLVNNQLTENTSNEFVIGTGYRFKEVEIIVNSGGRKRNFKSDLNLRADLSIRKDESVTRKLIENNDELISGKKVFAFKITADYVLSEKLNIRLFFDRTMTDPRNTQTFRTSNANFGVSIRFTLT